MRNTFQSVGAVFVVVELVVFSLILVLDPIQVVLNPLNQLQK